LRNLHTMRSIKSTVLATIVLICLSIPLTAQEDTGTETLFDQKDMFKNIGFVFAPSYSITSIDGYSTSILSLRGGVILNKKFTVGSFYNFSLNDIRPNSETVPGIHMDYQAGGGYIEYTIYSDKLIHFTFPLFIGGGEVGMDNEVGNLALGEQRFFMVEPSAMAEINLNKFVRFNLGAGYRIVNEMNYRNINQSDISGFSGYIGIKIGLFK
jgi:hypothetical protein